MRSWWAHGHAACCFHIYRPGVLNRIVNPSFKGTDHNHFTKSVIKTSLSHLHISAGVNHLSAKDGVQSFPKRTILSS